MKRFCGYVFVSGLCMLGELSVTTEIYGTLHSAWDTMAHFGSTSSV